MAEKPLLQKFKDLLTGKDKQENKAGTQLSDSSSEHSVDAVQESLNAAEVPAVPSSLPQTDILPTLPRIEESFAETAENPVHHDLVAVIADDRYDEQRMVNRALTMGIGRQYTSPEFKNAANIRELLTFAFTGKNGQQPDLITLDHDYRSAAGNWNISEDDIHAIGQKYKVDTNHFRRAPFSDDEKREYAKYVEKQMGRRIDTNTYNWDNLSIGGRMPDTIYEGTLNSIDLACILRGLGYKGKIVIVSSDPPEAEKIQKSYNSFRTRAKWLPEGLPVDGYLVKTSSGFDNTYECAWESKINDSGSRIWERQYIEGASLTAAVAVLFPKILQSANS